MSKNNQRGAVVALGMFDGVHLGHRALLSAVCAMAERLSAVPALYTFENHPLTVLGSHLTAPGADKGGPGKGACLLTSPEERKALFAGYGMERVIMEPFTKELAALEPEQFVRHLMELFPLKGVVCGYNYSFGRYGRGTPALLSELGERYGFETEVLQPVVIDGTAVSSTEIRGLLGSPETLDRGLLLLSHSLTVPGLLKADGTFLPERGRCCPACRDTAAELLLQDAVIDVRLTGEAGALRINGAAEIPAAEGTAAALRFWGPLPRETA